MVVLNQICKICDWAYL